MWGKKSTTINVKGTVFSQKPLFHLWIISNFFFFKFGIEHFPVNRTNFTALTFANIPPTARAGPVFVQLSAHSLFLFSSI